MAGVHGATVSGGIGSLCREQRSARRSAPRLKRFKDDIKPMDKASEALLSLKPVTFRYKKELDPAKTAQFGLVAEEVAKVDPDLVARDEQRPDLLRALRSSKRHVTERVPKGTCSATKEQALNAEQQRKISALEAEAVQTRALVKQLTITLEKVSARVEAQDSRGQLAENDR